MARRKTAAQWTMEARVRDLDHQIRLLRARADRIDGTEEREATPLLDRIRDQRETVGARLASFRSSSRSPVDATITGLQESLDELSCSVQEARTVFANRSGGN